MNTQESEGAASFLSPRILCICFVLFAVTFVLYWQVKDFSFVNIDDNLYVENNRHVKTGLTIENIKWAFTDATRITNFWAPLTWLSIILDYEWYGMDAGGYHITNLLLHLANSLLILFVFYRMTGSLWQSAFLAAMFALHPLHVESVAWVTERKDVLSTLFWLLTMWAYTSYAKSPDIRRYLLTFFCFILGLMSKPMLVTLPFVLLLLDFWPLNRIQISNPPAFRRDLFGLIREKTLFFILIFGVSVATFITQNKGDVLPPLSHISTFLRIENVIVSYSKYLWKMIWPFGLTVAYPYPNFLPLWQVITSLSLLICISFLSIYFVKRAPWLIVGWLWYLGTLVPVIGIVVIAEQAMADRYTYVPLIGIFIMIAWGFPELLNRLTKKKTVITIFFSCSVLLMAITTATQIRYWKNSKSLFEHAISVTEKNFMAYNNLGLAFQNQGKTNKAIEFFKEAIKIKPQYASAYNNLGVAMESIGKADQSINLYTIAIQLEPEFKNPYVNLAFVLLHQGKLEEATKYCRKAIQLDPDFTEAYILFGDIYEKCGHINESIKMYSKALQLDSNSASAHNYLGSVLLKINKIEKAISHFQSAIKLNSKDWRYHKNLETALDIKRNLDNQIKITLKTLRKQPDNFELNFTLGNLYKKKGQQEKAVKQFQKILSSRPESIPTLLSLASTYAEIENFEKSIALFKQLFSLQPENNALFYNIACLYAKQNKTGEALAWLKKAIDNGYANWELITTDNDLENIRRTDEYKKLIMELQK